MYIGRHERLGGGSNTRKLLKEIADMLRVTTMDSE